MAELVERVAAAAGVSKAEARRVIDALFDPRKGIIREALRAGGRVRLGAFGEFSLRRRPARAARDATTGQPFVIPPRVVVSFDPSPQLAAAARSKRSRPFARREQRSARSVPEPATPAGAPATVPGVAGPSAPTPPVSAEQRGLVESLKPILDHVILEAKKAPNPKLPLQLGGEARTDVQFTVYHPKEIAPRTWRTLLAYAHVPGALADVEKDSQARLGTEPDAYGRGKGAATTVIRRGAEITAVPELAGCRFNPPRATFLWLKDWHRAEFDVQAVADEPRSVEGQAVNGRVAYFVGPVLVGGVRIWSHLSDDSTRVDGKRESVSAAAYRRIFVSYAHQDANVVEALSRAYRALGDTYLRDVTALRSGEKWNPALLRMVDLADVFQLCWSRAAKRSRYVKQEWQHALGLKRADPFIRPTYWEEPMPPPPRELRSIHFTRLQLRGGSKTRTSPVRAGTRRG